MEGSQVRVELTEEEMSNSSFSDNMEDMLANDPAETNSKSTSSVSNEAEASKVSGAYKSSPTASEHSMESVDRQLLTEAEARQKAPLTDSESDPEAAETSAFQAGLDPMATDDGA